jgi:hypothetical protein
VDQEECDFDRWKKKRAEVEKKVDRVQLPTVEGANGDPGDAKVLTFRASHKLTLFFVPFSQSTRLDGAGYAGDQTRFFFLAVKVRGLNARWTRDLVRRLSIPVKSGDMHDPSRIAYRSTITK